MVPRVRSGRSRRDRPLAGIRVLDLTRVLAGPVATRFLALLGAEVLRIDPPDWDEPAVIPEVTPGKRCAHLDLRTAEGHTALTELLRDTDVFVHGYRPGALAGLDFDPATLDGLRPGLIDVALDAYGSTGPWAHRRGFDSLVQMSTGIAAAGMDHARADQPVPLPVQALDHATGYLMAAAALTGLHRRRTDATGSRARLSLARTAALLVDRTGPALPREPLAEPGVDPTVETTDVGPRPPRPPADRDRRRHTRVRPPGRGPRFVTSHLDRLTTWRAPQSTDQGDGSRTSRGSHRRCPTLRSRCRTAPTEYEALTGTRAERWNRFGKWERRYFPQVVGLELEEVRIDYARMRLAFRDELEQPAGVVHGGAIATLIDTVVVPAIGSGYDDFMQMLTLDLQVRFLGAAVKTDLVGEGWITRARSLDPVLPGRGARRDDVVT